MEEFRKPLTVSLPGTQVSASRDYRTAAFQVSVFLKAKPVAEDHLKCKVTLLILCISVLYIL